EQLSLEGLRAAHSEPLDVQSLYAVIERRGITYGSVFRTLRNAWKGATGALGRVELASGTDAVAYGLHPALLDGAFHLLAGISAEGDEDATYLPSGVDEIMVHAPGSSSCWVRATVRDANGAADALVADLDLIADDGSPLVSLR